MLAFLTAHFQAFVAELYSRIDAGGMLAGLGIRATTRLGVVAIASARFTLLPITPVSVLIFLAVMGSLWLATVPLTSGLVAHIYGIRYIGTLYGVVFLSHQIGGFLGVWLGGRMYDLNGSYTLVWWIGVGAFSALEYLPIRERPMQAQPA